MTSDERANAWHDLTRPFKDAVSALTQPAPDLYALLCTVEELPALNAEIPLPDFSPLEMLPRDSVITQNMATDQASKSSGTVARAGPQQAHGLQSPASSLPVPRRLRSPLPSSAASDQGSSGLAASTSDARPTVFPLGTGSPAASRERLPAQSDGKLSTNKQVIEQSTFPNSGKAEQVEQSATARGPALHGVDSFSADEAARQQGNRENRPRAIGENYVDVNAASYVDAPPLIDKAIVKSDAPPLESSKSHSFKTDLSQAAVDVSRTRPVDLLHENEAGSPVAELPQAMAIVNQLADEALQKTEGKPLHRDQPDLHSVAAARMKKLEEAADISSPIINGEANASPRPTTLYERRLSPRVSQESSRTESSSPAHKDSSERSAGLVESAAEAFSRNTIALIDELADGFMRSRMDSERQRPASGIRREPVSEVAINGAAPDTEATSTGSSSSPIRHGFSSDRQPRVEYAREQVLITANNSAQGVSAQAQSKTSGQPAVVNNPQQQLDADKIASLINDVLIEQARRHGVDIS